jgi:hypothetical protein
VSYSVTSLSLSVKCRRNDWSSLPESEPQNSRPTAIQPSDRRPRCQSSTKVFGFMFDIPFGPSERPMRRHDPRCGNSVASRRNRAGCRPDTRQMANSNPTGMYRPGLASDEVHPGDAGHHILSRWLIDLIRVAADLPRTAYRLRKCIEFVTVRFGVDAASFF